MSEFFLEFEEFCKSPNFNSGKAKSYANAIKYLFEYMNFSTVSDSEFLKLQEISLLIKEKTSSFYLNLLDFLVERKQSSYLLNGFIQAALSYFFRYYFYKNNIVIENCQDNIILECIKDSNLKAVYLDERLKRELPSAHNLNNHNYNFLVTNGTAKKSVAKIKSGRIAEKYFIDFLLKQGFLKDVEFLDVANDKHYGFDLFFLGMGIEIKNIKSGTFYLSDNEIAYLINGKTHIVFVDVDNGIWCLKSNSNWLKKVIQSIFMVREYCKNNYNNLDLTDIKIKIDEEVKEDLIDLTVLSKKEIIQLFE